MNDNLKELILSQVTGAVQEKMASRNKLDKASTCTAVEDALTAILGGLQQNVKTKSGAEKLDTALAKDHNGSVLDDLVGAVSDGSLQGDGAKILTHIFGKKKADVTDKVAENSGVNASAAGDILSTLAPIVLGQLGKAKQSNNLDAGGVADTILRQQLPKGTLTTLLTGFLDRDKDGQILDDLLDMGQGMLGKKK
jgi:hypothetical protein